MLPVLLPAMFAALLLFAMALRFFPDLLPRSIVRVLSATLTRPMRQGVLGAFAIAAAIMVAFSGPGSAQAVPDASQLQLERQLWSSTDVTCGDDDAGTSPVCAPTMPRGELLKVACNDGNGCTFVPPRPPTGQHQRMAGKVLNVVSTGTNAVTIADTVGLTEQASSAALGTYDSIAYRGITLTADGGVWGRWVETNRSNN